MSTGQDDQGSGSVGDLYCREAGQEDTFSRKLSPFWSVSKSTSLWQDQARIRDESEVFTAFLIVATVFVACCCGAAAFALHASVGYGGCLLGVNGCQDQIFLRWATSLGVRPSIVFIAACGISGLLCSLIVNCPCLGGAAKRCKGGGSAATKIAIACGSAVSGWTPILRILLATLYMSGGNPLGTEGPIVHLSTSLAMWLASKMRVHHKRKFLSTFGVIGAAAGICAGFNVLVTGIVYVIEELTRTLSRKLAIVLAFAAGVAVLFTDLLSWGIEAWLHIHPPHATLVPNIAWSTMSVEDVCVCVLISLPIGVLSGLAGWLFTHCADAMALLSNADSNIRKRFFPAWGQLMIVGIICGVLGAVAFETTGINGVWGTTAGAIPEALNGDLHYVQVVILFVAKFAAFTLATGAGGPGGAFVPSLVTGGFLGLLVGAVLNVDATTRAACAIIGMGSMFSSVMHLPLTGVILVFELTRADALLVPIVIANFIAVNTVCRLPHGSHSFVHRGLARDPAWLMVQERDFIETDEQEGQVNLALFESTRRLLFLTDAERLRIAFDAWRLPGRNDADRGLDQDRQGPVDGVAGCTSVSPRQPLASISPLELPNRSNPASFFLSQAREFISPRHSLAPRSPLPPRSHSPCREISKISIFSQDSMMSRSLTAEEAKRFRDERRETWEAVARIIPDLDLPLWKAMSHAQRRALAERAPPREASNFPTAPSFDATNPGAEENV